MTQIIYKLEYDIAVSEKKDTLLKLGRLVLDSNKSIMNMDVNELNEAIEKKLNKCMGQNSILSDFKYFADKYSEGNVKIEYSDTVKMMVKKIVANKKLIRQNIAAI